MWVKIPCQDCNCVRRIDLLLSSMVYCTARVTFYYSAEPCTRVILISYPFQRPLRKSCGPNAACLDA